MKKAAFMSLGKSDWVKTLIMLVLSTITGLILDAIVQQMGAGTYCFECIHWKQIGFAVLTVVLTYIQKNLGTNSEDKFGKKEPKPPTE